MQVLLLDVLFEEGVLLESLVQFLLGGLSEEFQLLLDPDVLSHVGLQFYQPLFVWVDLLLAFLGNTGLRVLFQETLPQGVEKREHFLFRVRGRRFLVLEQVSPVFLLEDGVLHVLVDLQERVVSTGHFELLLLRELVCQRATQAGVGEFLDRISRKSCPRTHVRPVGCTQLAPLGTGGRYGGET